MAKQGKAPKGGGGRTKVGAAAEPGSQSADKRPSPGGGAIPIGVPMPETQFEEMKRAAREKLQPQTKPGKTGPQEDDGD